MQDAVVESLLKRVRAQMDLDSETEQEIFQEISVHLQEDLARARAEGLDEAAAVARVAARFGLEATGRELQAAHAGWGTADAVIATALPVLAALILRWIVFAPDGTALGWRELLNRPSFWTVALVFLVVPLVRFERKRHALATWAVFWALTVVFVAWPALRW